MPVSTPAGPVPPGPDRRPAADSGDAAHADPAARGESAPDRGPDLDREPAPGREFRAGCEPGPHPGPVLNRESSRDPGTALDPGTGAIWWPESKSAAGRHSVLWRLTLTELKLFARERSGPVFAVGLPLVLLTVFGNTPFYHQHRANLGGFTLLDVYVPILASLVLATLSFNVVPQVLAGYREKGVLRRLRTTPVGPARVLAAQLLVNLATAAVSVAALLLVARFAFGVRLPRQAGGYLASIVLAALALLAIGLFVAAASPSGQAANAAGVALFYVMMFTAGLFFPIAAMPPLLQHISRAAPLGAAVQALTDATQGQGPHPLQLITLAAYAVAFGAAAVRLFRWE